MSQNTVASCSGCGSPAALRCSGCKTSMYCSPACQANDWPFHRLNCFDVRFSKVVERAAHTLQKVYFTFREQAFQRNVTKIEREGTNIVLYEDKACGKIKHAVFGTFPTELVKNYDDHAAVLSCMSCVEPPGHFHELVRQMLPGKDFFIEELHVVLKNKPFIIKIHYSDPGEPSIDNDLGMFHTVFAVKSCKTGTMWGIDVTGAEFGLTHPFWDWNKFYHKHVAYVQFTLPFGQVREYMKEASKIPGQCKLEIGIGMRGAAKVEAAVKSWVADSRTTLFKMLHDSDDEAFAKKQQALLEVVRSNARKFVEESDFSAVGEEAERVKDDSRIFARSVITRKALLKLERFDG